MLQEFERSPPKRYAEVRFLLDALQEHLFKDRKDFGAEFASAFNPLPLPLLALLLTCVSTAYLHVLVCCWYAHAYPGQTEYCLDCWADGRFNRALKFKEKDYRIKYDAHLAQLENWQSLSPVVVTAIRAKMFARVW